MSTLIKHCRIDENGNLLISVGKSEAGSDVEVTIRPMSHDEVQRSSLSDAERRRRLEEIAGSIDDPNFKRPPQPEMPKRNWDVE